MNELSLILYDFDVYYVFEVFLLTCKLDLVKDGIPSIKMYETQGTGCGMAADSILQEEHHDLFQFNKER